MRLFLLIDLTFYTTKVSELIYIVMNILKFLKKYRFESLLVMSGSFLWLRGIWTHYIYNEIPLGYDSGLYKVWFEEINGMQFRIRSELSGRLQSMFPPFLGMIWALLMKFWWSSEWLVMRWTVWLSWLVILITTAISRRFWSIRMSAIVFFFACSSFVLYELFWRNYLKQILGMFFLLSGVYGIILFGKKSVIAAIVIWIFLAVWWLTQRPALVLCGVVWILRFCSWLWKRTIWIWSIVALWTLAIVWWYFREIQVVPMIQPFFDAIDIPTYNDGYKSWWTFLTMWEWIRTDFIVMISGLLGFVVLCMKKKVRKSSWIFLIIYFLLILWIWGQASFYQRMIWYLSPFLIVWTWYVLSLVSYKKYGVYIVWVLCIIQWFSTIYWIYSSRTPLIAQQELDMIRQIPLLVEEDAIIMLSWIWYSPWVRGRSWREVIAPGLFDYTIWWNQWDGWTDEWIDVSWDQKCINAFNTFAYLKRPLYVRVWLTQDEEKMDWWCMERILNHSNLPTALYRLTNERK